MLKFTSRGLVVKLGSQTLARIRAVVPSLWSNNVCILYGYERYWEQGYLVAALTFCLALNQVLSFSVPLGIQHQWVDTRVLSTLVLHCVFLTCDRNQCLCKAHWIYMIKAVPLATMLVDKKKSSLISSFCSSTIGEQQTLDICSYHYLLGGTEKKNRWKKHATEYDSEK